MILVTLGTQDKPFTRLLESLEKLIKQGKITDEIIVQAGCTKFESDYMKIFDLIPTDEFEKLVSKCDILITHGGVGSILTGLTKNKKVIAVPRLAKYKEHTNDHQKQIVHKFSEDGYILEARDLNQIDRTITRTKTFHPKKFKSNTENMIKLIEKYIEEDSTSKENNIKSLFMQNKEIILYLFFGVLTTIISLMVYYILVYTIINPNNAVQLQIANIISWIISVAFAYVTNRKFVFESKNKNKIKEVTSFISSRIMTLFLDMLIMLVGVTILHGNDKIIKLVSQIVVIVGNYILSKVFVFKKEKQV